MAFLGETLAKRGIGDSFWAARRAVIVRPSASAVDPGHLVILAGPIGIGRNEWPA